MEVFNVKFVGEVEKHPVLYNHTLQEYSRKEYTEKAWNEISKEVNLSVGECKERWRNLRSTFVKNIRPKPSGSAGGKKKPYYLREAMQFAVPFLKVAGIPSGNLPEIPEERPSPSTTPIIGDAQEDIHLVDIQYGSTSSRPQAPFSLSDSTTSLSESRRDSLSPFEPGLRAQGNRKRKIKHTKSDADKAFSEYFAAKKATLSNKSPKDDKREGIKHFLDSLIPDLMKMDDVQLRAFKRKSLDTIDEIMGTEVLYRLSANEIHAYQGTPTADMRDIPVRIVDVPRSSISSPEENNLSIITDSSSYIYVPSTSEFSPEQI